MLGRVSGTSTRSEECESYWILVHYTLFDVTSVMVRSRWTFGGDRHASSVILLFGVHCLYASALRSSSPLTAVQHGVSAPILSPQLYCTNDPANKSQRNPLESCRKRKRNKCAGLHDTGAPLANLPISNTLLRQPWTTRRLSRRDPGGC